MPKSGQAGGSGRWNVQSINQGGAGGDRVGAGGGDGGQQGIKLAKVVGEFEVVDGGQWGIELAKVVGEFEVETAGSGGVGVGGGCDRGIWLQRWW